MTHFQLVTGLSYEPIVQRCTTIFLHKHFTEDESTLLSLGYNEDSESPVNYNVGPPINGMPENNWEIGQVENGFPINRCGSGDSCYGTDFDSVDYRASIEVSLSMN